MPEFILDMGSSDAAREFASLDEFTQGYVEALFFTNTGTPDDGDLEHATFADLAPETLAAIVADCAAFQQANAESLACDGGLPLQRAGNDFWYTRCGHGAGFWDGDWPEPHATRLTKASELFGNLDVYCGDDGLIYF